MKKLCSFLIACICTFGAFSQVPVYNSYPAASAVIFLDFDGHYLRGTSWNFNGPVTCGPSNLNNDQVTEVYRRVAEDFRPFNINVTTDSTKYWSAPATRRMRVVLTISSDWYGRAGGVAYNNSFTWGNNTPCFVFTALHGYNVKNIAEAASHEVGHTLGLRHQALWDASCTKLTDYNAGQGSNQIGWAPIMGVGYYRNQTTWHNGPNPFGCANAQDDLAIITNTTNGFGYRPNNGTGVDFKTAIPIDNQNNELIASGVITTSTDNNFFKLSVGSISPVSLKVTPYSVASDNNGSNLDVELKLYNSDKELINTYNPPELLSAALDTTLNPGNYYVVVSGVGNAYTTDYASLGSYTISGVITTFTVLPLRQLQLKGSIAGSAHKLAWIVDADEKITKQTIEVSANGRPFETAAHIAGDARTYSHIPYTTGTWQYRVQVTMDNGRQYYSNITTINNDNHTKPRLTSQVVYGNTITAISPGIYAYVITDASGKLVGKGQVTEGTSVITTANLSKGMYVITFNNTNEQHIEKFIRQ